MKLSGVRGLAVNDAPEPKNEEALCAAVGKFVGERRRETLVELGRPEDTERHRKAVERVFESPTGRFVVEHTRIESYPGQIEDGRKFGALLGPLEQVFTDRLPLPEGKYSLTVAAGAAGLVRERELAEVRMALGIWIANIAPTLQPHRPGVSGHTATARPDGVPFEVRLQRWSAPGSSRLLSYRSIPEDLERLREARVNTALHAKIGKLAAAKREFSATESILILESDDIALANSDAVGQAIRAVRGEHTELPDTIYLVETNRGLGWQLWVMKAGNSVFPDIDSDVGPFEIRDDTPPSFD